MIPGRRPRRFRGSLIPAVSQSGSRLNSLLKSPRQMSLFQISRRGNWSSQRSNSYAERKWQNRDWNPAPWTGRTLEASATRCLPRFAGSEQRFAGSRDDLCLRPREIKPLAQGHTWGGWDPLLEPAGLPPRGGMVVRRAVLGLSRRLRSRPSPWDHPGARRP